MPKDWQEAGLVYVDLFRRFGCDYLSYNSLWDVPTSDWNATGISWNNVDPFPSLPAEQTLFWPANFGVGTPHPESDSGRSLHVPARVHPRPSSVLW